MHIIPAGTLTFADFRLTTVSASVASITWAGGATPPSGLAAVLAGAVSFTTEGRSDSGSIAVTFSAADFNFDFLAANETLTVVYNVTATDNSGVSLTRRVTVTITGTNDAPVLAADASGPHAVTEGLSTTGTLTFTDVDLTDHHTVSTSLASAPTWSGGTTLPSGLAAVLAGALSATTTNSTGSGSGSIAATFSAADSAFDFLADGQTLTVTYNVMVTDNNGFSSSQPVTITIIGTNDGAVIDGVVTGAVTEDVNVVAGNISTGGVLTITDPDQGQSNFTAQASTPGSNGYGTFTLAADGTWTYTANNSLTAIQLLNAGQSLTNSFTAVSSDGTASQIVTVTIHGTNDGPIAVADTNAGDPVVESGVNPGNTPFAGDPTAVGNVLTNDTDLDTNHVLSVAAVAGSAANVGNAVTGIYGSVTVNSDGSYSYTLNNADPDTEALYQGQVVTDQFTYTVTDEFGATSSSTLTITIAGTNDGPIAVANTNAGDPVVESGVNPGNTPFAGDPTAVGNVLTNDTDLDTHHVLSVAAVAGSAANVGNAVIGIYGSVTISSNGSYTYTLNNADPDTEALSQGQVVTDQFTYTMTDEFGATSSSTLTITIIGTDDAPVVTPGAAAVVSEEGLPNGIPNSLPLIIRHRPQPERSPLRMWTPAMC